VENPLSRTVWLKRDDRPYTSPDDDRTRVFRFARFNSVGVLMVVTVTLFWWLGSELMSDVGQNRAEERTGYSPPLQAMPKISQLARDNIEIAGLHLAVDLEGTAVAYPEEVNGLVGPDGKFRADLSVDEMARILKIDSKKIAKRGSQTEIDPEAELFTAVTGRLSESAKAHSRQLREIEASLGHARSAVGHEWVETEVSFSLNILMHPNQDQTEILDSISRAARTVKRQPGAKINATPVMAEPGGGRPNVFQFTGGFLPLEAPTAERCVAEDHGEFP
jgi:hypothetical protein